MKRFLAIFILFSAFFSVQPTVEAGLLFWKKKQQQEDPNKEYPPPAANAEEVRCEPIREKIVELNQLPFYRRVFVGPYIGWKVQKHRQCKQAVKQEEFRYLKHVKINEADSTPFNTPAGETTLIQD